MTHEVGSEQGALRFGWWSGIAAVVLMVAGFFAVDEGGSTPAGASVDALAREITGSVGRVVAGSLVGMLGATGILGFVASLRVRLSRAGHAGDVLGLVALGFGVIMTAGALAYGALRVAATAIRDPDVLAEAMRALAIVQTQASTVLLWGAIGLVATMCTASFVSGLLPRAMAYVGVAIAIGAVVFTPTDRGGVGLMLLPWIAGSCVLLLREGRREPPHATT